MSSFDQIALLLIILVPLAGGILSVFLPRNRPEDAWRFAIFVSAITLGLSLILFARYDFGAGGYQFVRVYEWLDAPLNIDLSLAMDGIAAPLVLLNGIVLFGAVLISQTIKRRTRDFFVLLLSLGSGVFGVFVVQDLFFLFFFYELAVLPMYLLIGVWGSSTDFATFSRTKEYGAMKLMLFLVAGSVLIWVGILALYVAASQVGSPTFSLVTLGELSQAGHFGPGFQNWVFPFVYGWVRHPGRFVALPYLVARRPRGRTHRCQYASRRCADEIGGFRHHPGGHGVAPGGRRRLDAGADYPRYG